jgi:hypothetical protein
MDNIILEKVKELLSKNENIGIAVGQNPGVDEMGAALALYLALSSVKNTTIISPTEPIVEVSSLVGIDKVKSSFGGGSDGDLTVSFPYREGEIEKISYTLEEGKLNILVKAGEKGLTFNEEDIEFKRAGGAPGLIFTVGVPRISDLGSAFAVEALKDSKIINIDYKPENQGYGDVPLLGRNASSVSELMANFISSLGLKMDIDISSNLLTGIMAATNNFQASNTSSLAFETVAYLMKKGAVRKTVEAKKEIIGDAFFNPAMNNYAKTHQPATTPLTNISLSGDDKKPDILSTPANIDEDNPPEDWLSPKIYKGSTSV